MLKIKLFKIYENLKKYLKGSVVYILFSGFSLLVFQSVFAKEAHVARIIISGKLYAGQCIFRRYPVKDLK